MRSKRRFARFNRIIDFERIVLSFLEKLFKNFSYFHRLLVFEAEWYLGRQGRSTAQPFNRSIFMIEPVKVPRP